jgi:hypothetical protein
VLGRLRVLHSRIRTALATADMGGDETVNIPPAIKNPAADADVANPAALCALAIERADRASAIVCVLARRQ